MKNEQCLDIEVGVVYITSFGSKVKVICTDFKNSDYTIVGILNYGNTNEMLCVRHLQDTLEWNKYDPLYDLKVDDKVFIRDNKDDEWYPRHFAEVKNGKIAVFIFGKTSFTNNSDETCSFNYWKKAD